MTIERRRGFLRVTEHQAQELERWAFPDYADEQLEPRDNAINYDPQWEPEPLEPEEEPGPPPLTAADLDEIRQSAYEEGVAEGRSAGHDEGFEVGKQAGLEAGLLEGREQGLAEGIAQGQQVITEHVSALASVIEKLAAPLQQMDVEVESQVVNMVVALAKELIRVEVQTNPQVILQTVREVVSALPIAGRSITLQLHPEDLAIIRDAYSEDDLANRQWQLQAEPAMNRGDLQVSSGDSSVDFLMEDRIRQLLQQFQGVNQQPPGAA
ncbi:flagellar assembly protein FliH [Photobacterium jeanii]|uniref:Flagellar assembly protein FliH n=1 Tax=Photobacterium jeanii TaxID=858640 RepID=A0A178KMY7_9GAMM|nr:flagellar assembly protein FliH [Photobacterium jeanii]OAN18611.1 flagellar assembly protein FliH [Photobacterium jeanii]PST91709.1 flagellar assembly protein FliH [Photobacterium jeanii]